MIHLFLLNLSLRKKNLYVCILIQNIYILIFVYTLILFISINLLIWGKFASEPPYMQSFSALDGSVLSFACIMSINN